MGIWYAPGQLYSWNSSLESKPCPRAIRRASAKENSLLLLRREREDDDFFPAEAEAAGAMGAVDSRGGVAVTAVIDDDAPSSPPL